MKQSKADKKATATLTKWIAAYVEARGALPSMGISMFSRPGAGVPVRCSVTGTEIAYFTNYEAASLGFTLADRASRARVAELSADSI